MTSGLRSCFMTLFLIPCLLLNSARLVGLHHWNLWASMKPQSSWHSAFLENGITPSGVWSKESLLEALHRIRKMVSEYPQIKPTLASVKGGTEYQVNIEKAIKGAREEKRQYDSFIRQK